MTNQLKPIFSTMLCFLFEIIFIPIIWVFSLFYFLRWAIIVISMGLAVTIILTTIENTFAFRLLGLDLKNVYVYIPVILVSLGLEVIVISVISRKADQIGQNFIPYMKKLNNSAIKKIKKIFQN